MVYQTYDFLLQAPVSINLLCFVFFSTIASYSFHWGLTMDSVIPSPRISWLKKNRGLYLVLFIIGIIGSAVFFFYLLPWWPWLLLSALITFLYSAPKIPHRYFRALRKVALGKTIFLSFVWMYVTTILPILVSGQDWKNEFFLFIGSRFFLIYAICILFDYRDRADDKKAGIRSLITFLNERGIGYLFVFSLLVFTACTVLLLKYDYRVVDVIILLIPGIITAGLYNYARKNFSDTFYYFVLDGLMAFSAMLMLIPW